MESPFAAPAVVRNKRKSGFRDEALRRSSDGAADPRRLARKVSWAGPERQIPMWKIGGGVPERYTSASNCPPSAAVGFGRAMGDRAFSHGIHRRFMLTSPGCAIFATHESAKHEK
jgi:hypothetical protein